MCEKLKKLNQQRDFFNMHRKLKKRCKKPLTALINENNKPILKKEEKQSVWVRYVQELFKNERSDKVSMSSSQDIGSLISKT